MGDIVLTALFIVTGALLWWLFRQYSNTQQDAFNKLLDEHLVERCTTDEINTIKRAMLETNCAQSAVVDKIKDAVKTKDGCYLIWLPTCNPIVMKSRLYQEYVYLCTPFDAFTYSNAISVSSNFLKRGKQIVAFGNHDNDVYVSELAKRSDTELNEDCIVYARHIFSSSKAIRHVCLGMGWMMLGFSPTYQKGDTAFRIAIATYATLSSLKTNVE